MDLTIAGEKLKVLGCCYIFLTSAALLLYHQLVVQNMRQEEQQERRRQRQPALIAAAAAERRCMRRNKRMWVRQWLLRRPVQGQYDQLMQELEAEDLTSFRNFLRMDPNTFIYILERVGPRITKKDTFWRKALTPGMKLAITLRYLATGNSYKSLQYSFRVAYNTICNFIPVVCQAIIDEFCPEVMVTPTAPEGWRELAQQFEKRWNLPHCVGAIDGKHVAIKKPQKSGSFYYNYKGFFSIVLLAVVDADYKFIYADVGANGSGSDSGIFNDTELKRRFEDNTIGLPPAEPLANAETPIQYFLVGDDAFALKTWMMKPLPMRNMNVKERIFNYRVSRARRVVENAFGILAARFRCLLTTIPLHPDRVTTVTMACCVLHNILRQQNAHLDAPLEDHEDPVTHEVTQGAWREGAVLADMGQIYQGRNASNHAKQQRRYLIEYVNSEAGSVPWQEDMI